MFVTISVAKYRVKIISMKKQGDGLAEAVEQASTGRDGGKGSPSLRPACSRELTDYAKSFTRARHTDFTERELELADIAEKLSSDEVLAGIKARVIQEDFCRRYMALAGRPITENECEQLKAEAHEYYETHWKSAHRLELSHDAKRERFVESFREQAREELALIREARKGAKAFPESVMTFVANRGEIACRIIESSRKAGKQTLIAHDGADLPYDGILGGDEKIFHIPAYCDRGKRPEHERLDIWSMKALAFRLRAEGMDPFDVGVHPGWGFNAEDDAWFYEMEKLGFRMVGPHSSVIRFLGNKINATQVARQAGLATPESSGKVESVEQALKFFRSGAGRIKTFLLKDALGGGGHGQMLLNDPTQREFTAAVEKFLEKYSVFSADQFLDKTRHIEFQFLSDLDGNVVFGSPRDCTQQRDRQKVIEETAILGHETQTMMRASIRGFLEETGRRTGHHYAGAGTFEFLYEPASETYFFLEVNTRLQVEHPVSAHRDGIDYVRTQLDIADGYRLVSQEEADSWGRGGHAMEARVCLERVLGEDERRIYLKSGHDRTFGPVTGATLTRFVLPEMDGLTIYRDIRIGEGVAWSGEYDSMIMKAVVHGEDRAGAIALLKEAVNGIVIEGREMYTNKELILGILDEEEFTKGAALENRSAVKNVVLHLQIKNETRLLVKTLHERGAPNELERLYIHLRNLTPIQADSLKAEIAALGAVEAFKLHLVGGRGGIARLAISKLMGVNKPVSIRTTIYPQAFPLLLRILARIGAEPSAVIKHFAERETMSKKMRDGLERHDPERLNHMMLNETEAIRRMAVELARESAWRVILREKRAKEMLLRSFMGEMEKASIVTRWTDDPPGGAGSGPVFEVPERLIDIFRTFLKSARGEAIEDSFHMENRFS
jgi:acetyl/propionyl-CoA carboxylase alpha subunit